MKRRPFSSVCLLLVCCCSCGDSTPAEASREARIERTTELLELVLFDDAAQVQAERYVDMCDSYPEDLFFEANRAVDPDGPQRFNNLAEAFDSPQSSSTGLALAEAACTPAGLDRVRAFANI